MKDNLQNGRKYSQVIYLTKDVYLEYIKNSYNSIIKIQITHLKSDKGSE